MHRKVYRAILALYKTLRMSMEGDSRKLCRVPYPAWCQSWLCLYWHPSGKSLWLSHWWKGCFLPCYYFHCQIPCSLNLPWAKLVPQQAPSYYQLRCLGCFSPCPETSPSWPFHFQHPSYLDLLLVPAGEFDEHSKHFPSIKKHLSIRWEQLALPGRLQV